MKNKIGIRSVNIEIRKLNNRLNYFKYEMIIFNFIENCEGEKKSIFVVIM